MIAVLHGAENRVPVKIAQVARGHEDGDRRHRGQPLLLPHGIDYKGLLRAAVTDSNGAVTQGGSTITQQYVKNVLLYSADSAQAAAGGHRQVLRPQAARGPARAGAGGALNPRARSSRATSTSPTSVTARTASARPPAATSARRSDKLTLPQAALLAGLVQSPSADDPDHLPEGSPEAPRRGAGPHARARTSDAGAGGGSQRGAPRPAPGRPACDRRPLPDLHRAVLLRLGTHAAAYRPGARLHPATAAQQPAARRRPDDQDHAQPGRAGTRPRTRSTRRSSRPTASRSPRRSSSRAPATCSRWPSTSPTAPVPVRPRSRCSPPRRCSPARRSRSSR